MGKREEQREHIAILEVAVVALDRLVDEGPYLLGAAALGGAPHRQEAEGRQAQRGGDLIEQGGLGALVRGAALLGVARGEQGQGVENLPTRLRLGAVQGVDELLDKGNEHLWLALGEQVDHASGELARAAARARQVVDEGRERIGAVLNAREAGGLLGGQLDGGFFCHVRTSCLSYRRCTFSLPRRPSATSGSRAPSCPRRSNRDPPPPSCDDGGTPRPCLFRRPCADGD